MERLNNLIGKLGKPIVMAVSFLLFVITAVLVNTVLKPVSIQYLTQTYNYTADIAYQMLSDYGEAGRNAHINVLAADIVMVILYSMFLPSSINKTYGKILQSRKLILILSIIPLLLALLQLTEVAGVYGMLTHYPRRMDSLAKVIGIITSVKYYLTYLCFLMPVAGFILSRVLKLRHIKEMPVK